VDIEKLKEFADFLEKRKLKKIQYKQGDFEIFLEKADEPAEPSLTQPLQKQVVIQEKELTAIQAQEKELAKWVISPMVGTFYGTPSPDQPPFVKIGDQVTEDTVVCIIEAMKVMNEVKAGVRGIIEEVLMESSRPVEFGSKLFRIKG
jgi:acetyl-CoA carboxylase biotin carboxyl carrier protein